MQTYKMRIRGFCTADQCQIQMEVCQTAETFFRRSSCTLPDRKHCGGVNAVAPPGANLIKQATQRAIYYSTSEWCLARRKDSLCRRKARNGVRQIYALACCFCFSCLENSMHKSLTTSYGSRISTLKWECYKLPLRI